ncbi:MAG TPA: MBL fold metallo-hydrolase [Egibacteraceae bacterium]|nr:MBL fold metallo-hydrolase [Egibacteraceae bacterium]
MRPLTLTVLGSSGTHPGPARACASYLVEHEGYRLLLDCGNGSLANLQQRFDVADIDALLVSHLHPDHFVDLYGLYYARRFHRDGPLPLPVYAPVGAAGFIGRLLGSDEEFRGVCRFTESAAGETLDLGPLTVRLHAADHPVETLAPRVEAGGRVLAYSGDSGPTPALVDCARDADLFLCDATWLDRDGPHPAGVHMTGKQAGAHAAAAGAASLVLTHVYPTIDRDEVAAEAAAVYDGTILVARDLEEHPLTDGHPQPRGSG